MKKILTILLLPLAIIGLIYLNYSSIAEPVKFQEDRAARENVGIQRLKDIRTLQVAFKGKYGRFTSSMDSLKNFYNNDFITIIKQIGSMDDSLAVAQKLVRRDSIKINVKDTLLKRAGFSIDSIGIIPFSGGEKVIMESVIKQVSGVSVPLFEACMPFNSLLKGLDRQLIINLKAEREKLGQYPGLRVGNIETPNNNAGNWE